MRPVLFRLVGIPVYSYAVLSVLAVAAGLGWAHHEVQVTGDPVMRAAFWKALAPVFVWSLVGARAVHIAFQWDEYRNDWRSVWRRWRPGMSFHGGMIGSVFGAWLAGSAFRLGPGAVLDIVAPSAALGHAIGRLGCFLNGCCFGKPTGVFWGVRFQNASICPDDRKRHPTQVYEAVGLLVLFAWLAAPLDSWAYPGERFALWLAGYGVLRFFGDFLRAQMKVAAAELTYSQWASVGMFAAAAAYHFFHAHP